LNRFDMRALIQRVRFVKKVRRAFFFLAPATLGLACIAAIVFNHEAIAQMERENPFSGLKNRVVAALQNPFAILDERSPGSRGSGPQHLTKTAGSPHERVLAETREHERAPDAPPGVDALDTTGSGPAATIGPDSLSGVPFSSGNAPNVFSPFNGAFGIPNAFLPIANGDAPSPAGTGNPATPPITNVGNPGAFLPTGTGNSEEFPSPIVTDIPPQITTDTPGTPPITGSGTPTIPVPEPASWGLMLFGVLAVAALRHSQKRRLAARPAPGQRRA
jgi:hypothetical protein